MGGISKDGIIHQGVEVKLLPMDKGQEGGEICVHSERMIRNYYRNKEASERAFIYLDGKVLHVFNMFNNC